MAYYIVEKDVEEKIGFIHNKAYTSKKEAQKYIRVLRETLSKDYYDIFIAQME
jgi:hypothetical protein